MLTYPRSISLNLTKLVRYIWNKLWHCIFFTRVKQLLRIQLLLFVLLVRFKTTHNRCLDAFGYDTFNKTFTNTTYHKLYPFFIHNAWYKWTVSKFGPIIIFILDIFCWFDFDFFQFCRQLNNRCSDLNSRQLDGKLYHFLCAILSTLSCPSVSVSKIWQTLGLAMEGCRVVSVVASESWVETACLIFTQNRFVGNSKHFQSKLD